MSAPAPVDLAQARAALAAVVPRLTRRKRSITDPTRHAIGVWSAGDVAVHLANAWELIPALAARRVASPLRELRELEALTRVTVARESDRDSHTVADRIDAAAAEFNAAMGRADESGTAPWLVQGVDMPLAVFACHLLSESLVHGDDIARAERRTWPIERRHAALAVDGFAVPVMRALPPSAMVDQRRAAGLQACFDVRLRGGRSTVIAIDNGALTIDPPAARPVDCHLSADPTAMLLVMYGRRRLWSAVGRGQIIAWGRRPWLAPRLRTALRNP